MSSNATKFESLLEAVPDALVGMDQKGVIRFVNRQTELLFGYDRDDLIDQPLQKGRAHGWRVEPRQEFLGYFDGEAARLIGPGPLRLVMLFRAVRGGLFPKRRDRARVLKSLAEQAIAQADHLTAAGLPASAVDAVVASESLRDLGNDRVTFRHDVLREWAVANLLFSDPSLVGRLPLGRPAPGGPFSACWRPYAWPPKSPRRGKFSNRGARPRRPATCARPTCCIRRRRPSIPRTGSTGSAASRCGSAPRWRPGSPRRRPRLCRSCLPPPPRHSFAAATSDSRP